MLILQGVPIRTCLDFYKLFNFTEVLAQPDEFIVFAKSHLMFDSNSKVCLELFELAASDNISTVTSPCDFRQGKALSEIPNSVVEEFFAYFSTKKPENWGNKFIMATSAAILAKSEFKSPESKLNNGKQGIFLNPQGLAENIETGKVYIIKYDPNIDFPQGEKIKTVSFTVKGDDGSSSEILFGSCGKIVVNSGESVFVNYCGDVAVSILPNEVNTPYGKLKKNFKKGCITFNGELTDIPLKATAFTCIGQGQFLYINEGCFSFIGINDENIPYSLYKINAKYVEIDIHGSEFYLLTPTGVVKGKNGTPEALHSHFVSLSNAFKSLQ